MCTRPFIEAVSRKDLMFSIIVTQCSVEYPTGFAAKSMAMSNEGKCSGKCIWVGIWHSLVYNTFSYSIMCNVCIRCIVFDVTKTIEHWIE